MKPIFISHSLQDCDLAETLARWLERRTATLADGTVEPLTVWRVLPGQSLIEITRALNEAPVVIVIWSKDAVRSKWVYAEADRASAQRKLVTVLANRVDPKRIPLPFNTVHACPLDDRVTILTALRKIIAGERTKPPVNLPGAVFLDARVDPRQPPQPAMPPELSTPRAGITRLSAGSVPRRISAKTIGRFVLLGLVMVSLPPSDDVVTHSEPRVVRIGYRVASFPFSYRDGAGQPAGYSIDICNAVVERMRRRHAVKVEYVEVTSETRLQAVRDGRVDLECGTTTNNLERRKLGLDFSPLIFVTSTRVMVPAAMDYRSVHDLKGLKVAVTRETTNAQALKDSNDKYDLGINFITCANEEGCYRALERGEADAFAADEVLLYSQLAWNRSRDRFKVVGRPLSDDPYGIAFRRNRLEVRADVERTVRSLVAKGDIAAIWRNAFESPLPNGEFLNMPMPPRLEESFKVLLDSGEAD